VKRWAWPTLPGFASRSGFDPFGYAPILHRVTEGKQGKLRSVFQKVSVKRWAWPTLPGFASRSGFDPFGYAQDS
jgi:hypothetical protein